MDQRIYNFLDKIDKKRHFVAWITNKTISSCYNQSYQVPM